MNRRDFFKLGGGLGLSLMLPPIGRAAGPTSKPPLLVTIQAQGGWDVTMICDPKGHQYSGGKPVEINRDFTYAETRSLGNQGLRVAPYEFNQEFFYLNWPHITVLNGVNTHVVSHPLGEQATWTGKRSGDYPSLAALYAATHGPTLPLAFYSAGGFDAAASLIGVSRLSNPNEFETIVNPPHDLPTSDWLRVIDRIQQRAGFLSSNASGASRLRREQQMAATMHEAHLGAEALGALKGLTFPSGTGSDPLKKQAYLILKAYKEGLLCSGNLVVPNFDTHADNDARQKTCITALFGVVNYLMSHAAQEIDNEIIVVIGSDFGRAPSYNDEDGKDHYPLGSYLVLNPATPDSYFAGSGTVHGETTFNQEQVWSQSLSTEQVHGELRRLLNLEQGVASEFPI
jgi:hypothetical protein